MDSSTLYVSDLPRSMAESDLQKVLLNSGVTTFKKVSMIRNRRTGALSGNGYLSFYSRDAAMEAYRRLHGKVIPDSRPPVRYFLTHAEIKGGRPQQLCLWVGNLPGDMDDDGLALLFGSRFQSVVIAKVVRDEKKQSRGFGFLRFSDVVEHSEALIQMEGFKLDSGQRLRVIPAEPKRLGSVVKQVGGPQQRHPSEDPLAIGAKVDTDGDDSDENVLVDHSLPPDVETLNRDLMEETSEYWEAIDHASWLSIPNSSTAEVGALNPGATSWEQLDPLADECAFYAQLV